MHTSVYTAKTAAEATVATVAGKSMNFSYKTHTFRNHKNAILAQNWRFFSKHERKSSRRTFFLNFRQISTAFFNKLLLSNEMQPVTIKAV